MAQGRRRYVTTVYEPDNWPAGHRRREPASRRDPTTRIPTRRAVNDEAVGWSRRRRRHRPVRPSLEASQARRSHCSPADLDLSRQITGARLTAPLARHGPSVDVHGDAQTAGTFAESGAHLPSSRMVVSLFTRHPVPDRCSTRLARRWGRLRSACGYNDLTPPVQAGTDDRGEQARGHLVNQHRLRGLRAKWRSYPAYATNRAAVLMLSEYLRRAG